MPVEYLEDGSAVVTLGQPRVWTSSDLFTWIAFGERRNGAYYLFPPAEWSLDWGHWPPQNLADAFCEIWSGVPWQPIPGSFEAGGAEADRAWARKIMERTGTSARELARLLEADIQGFRRNEARYQNAKAQGMAAIRDGRLPVWARKAQGHGAPNYDAVPELLNYRLFANDETREVNDSGWVDGSGHYKGPWWDQVRFDADKVLAIWPVPPFRVGIASCDASLLPAPEQSSPQSADTLMPVSPKRKHTGLDYQAADAPLVEEMWNLIEGDDASSATDAARAVCDRAAGKGQPASKVARLVKHYGETYPGV